MTEWPMETGGRANAVTAWSVEVGLVLSQYGQWRWGQCCHGMFSGGGANAVTGWSVEVGLMLSRHGQWRWG